MESKEFSLSYIVCRGCGPSDIDTDYFVTFKAIKDGNRGKIICTKCGKTAWDADAGKDLENIPGEQLDQMILLVEQFEKMLSQ